MSKVSEIFEQNPLMFGLYYCKNHFNILPPPDFHAEIVSAALSSQFLAIQAPRGSAKSTILTFLMSLHGICFARERFIIIVQNTFAKSAGSLDTIKSEVKKNELLRQHFPLKITKDAEGDSIFAYDGGYECRVLCKGADQIGSIRGEKFGSARPTLIIMDDAEDDEMVKNPERRMDFERLFNDVLKFAGDLLYTRQIVIGTILHDDSMLAKLMMVDRYKDFTKLFYQARVGGVSLWPRKWTVEYLAKLEADDPVSFAKEMQGDPSSGIFEEFKREDFRFWKKQDGQVLLYDSSGGVTSKYSLVECKGAIACDLAWEEKRESDSSVIMPGYITPLNDILIDDYVCKKGMRPDEQEEILFTLDSRMEKETHSKVCIGFEKAKLEKVMKWLLDKAMRRRQHYLWLKDLKWDTDKIQRIVLRLSGRISQHTVYFRHGMGDLENQLLRIRSTAHDDLADAAQGLVQLLEYPKQIRKKPMEDDAFERIRKFTIDAKSNERKKYMYGKSRNQKEVPAIKSPI